MESVNLVYFSQFHESWRELSQWLTEAEAALSGETSISNEPDKIKAQIVKHKVTILHINENL